MNERLQPSDAFWSHDEAIGEVTLWEGEHYTLRLKAHIADEVYRQGRNAEIVPLAHQLGVRTYVQARPYVLVPDVTVEADLSPAPDLSGAIGTVASSTWEGMRHEELGLCQAWYYVEDQTLVLWETYFNDPYRLANPLEDGNTYALWQGFEGFLTARFPAARLLATTQDDPFYQTQQYQQFLVSLGYHQLNAAAFGKELAPRTP